MVGFSSLRIATFPPDMRTDFFNQDAYDLMRCPCDLTLIGQISTAWKNVVGKQLTIPCYRFTPVHISKSLNPNNAYVCALYYT